MTVLDNVTNEIGLFWDKLYLPKTTSTRRQQVEIAFISGNLVSIDFIKIKQDKQSTMQPILWSVTLERFSAITRHANEITLTPNDFFFSSRYKVKIGNLANSLYFNISICIRHLNALLVFGKF